MLNPKDRYEFFISFIKRFMEDWFDFVNLSCEAISFKSSSFNLSLFLKFNIGNEFAVNLYKNNKIKYTDIYRIIK